MVNFQIGLTYFLVYLKVLGPLLFLIFINDLTHVIDHTNMRLFADDTCLFITVDNRITASNAINDNLRAIQN